MIQHIEEKTCGLADREIIKLVVRGLYDAQKVRIETGNRISRLVRDEIMTEEDAKRFLQIPFERLEQYENEMQKIVVKQTKNLPIVKDYLKHVRGVGPRLSGLLVALIGDIERFPNVAKLWAYAGLHVVDGKAAKRAKGQKANWNAELKTTAWKIGGSFIKAGGPYREYYDREKCRLIERETNRGNDIYGQVGSKMIVVHEGISQGADETQSSDASQKQSEIQAEPASQLTSETHAPTASQRHGETPKTAAKHEWTLMRIHNMAMRKTVKLFLSHLWQVWREMEGLPTRQPYPIEYLGHTTFIDPWDFVTKPAE